MAYASITLLFLLLPFFSNAYQNCPHLINYSCPDFHGDSMMFPFTNSSLPDCGLCILECKDSNSTAFQCGQQKLSYKTKAIFPHNTTVVLTYPGLHGLISNVCTAHQNDGIILPNPPLTSLTILDLVVFYRCSNIENGRPPTLGVRLTTCGDDVVYGPYATDKFPDGLPLDYSTIKLPKSTDDNFSIVYKLPDECSECASNRARCIDQTTKEFHCPDKDCSTIKLDPNSTDDNFSIRYKLPDKCSQCTFERSRCIDQTIIEFHCPKQGMTRFSRLGVIVGSFVGTLVLICVVLFCMRRELKDKFTWDNQSFETFLESYGSLAPKRYRYTDIKKMTNSFKDKLGEGGYGGVYKGKLLDGRLVAVKLLKQAKGGGEDFINEVASISRTNHVNIVTLLGFCCAGRKRALVYEFMENGSLEKFTDDGTTCSQSLPLETLFHIVLGIARGLEYLHQGCKTRILHFDIKPHNILLDKDFCPKISDFGLAKVSQQNKQSKVSMSGTRGTVGYISPEMFSRNFGDVSHKSDVYSYGMMVLEIIGSRKRQDAMARFSSELIFPQWIYDELKHGDDAEVDGITQNLNDEKGLKRKMIIVSLWCIQTVPSCRPSMSSVLRMLEGSLDSIQIPPMPFLSSPPSTHFDPSGSSIATLGTQSSRNFR